MHASLKVLILENEEQVKYLSFFFFYLIAILIEYPTSQAQAQDSYFIVKIKY